MLAVGRAGSRPFQGCDKDGKGKMVRANLSYAHGADVRENRRRARRADKLLSQNNDWCDVIMADAHGSFRAIR